MGGLRSVAALPDFPDIPDFPEIHLASAPSRPRAISPPPIRGAPSAFRECHLAYALRPAAAVLDDQVEHLQPFGSSFARARYGRMWEEKEEEFLTFAWKTLTNLDGSWRTSVSGKVDLPAVCAELHHELAARPRRRDNLEDAFFRLLFLCRRPSMAFRPFSGIVCAQGADGRRETRPRRSAALPHGPVYRSMYGLFCRGEI